MKFCFRPIAVSELGGQDFWMSYENETYEHLIALRSILLREGARHLARSVEHVLAIIAEGIDSQGEAEGAWRAMRQFPRGLPDFGIWRDDEHERFRLNAELEALVQAIDRAFD